MSESTSQKRLVRTPADTLAKGVDPAPPAAVLTAADLALIEGYLQGLLPRLRLSEWKVQVAFDAGVDDACAMVDAPLFQRRAVVTLGPQFVADSPDDRRDTLVHELLHLVLMGVWQYTDQLLEQEMSARTARVAWLGFVGHVEHSVDDLAHVLAPFMPLPPALSVDVPPPADMV